jgi:hypothetical protein
MELIGLVLCGYVPLVLPLWWAGACRFPSPADGA